MAPASRWGRGAPEFFRPQRSEVTGPRRRSFASRLPSPGRMAPAQRCPLCRQTFFCGRGHVYSRKHQRQLKVALERLLPQVRTGGWRGPWTAWGGAAGGSVKARGGGIWGSRRGATWPVRLGILSATGGGRPQGCPRRPGGALRARARAMVLVPVLRL